MKIKLTSIFVENQDQALQFYTEVLGFIKKQEIPLGEFKWLTVISPDGPNDLELLLEPNVNPAAQTYQQALFQQGIPATMFFVENAQQEYERLKNLGVRFTIEPTQIDSGVITVFDDTCGNLIQLFQG
jgi:predicted enzyme related to lactoylglutathione lyase